MQNVEKELPGLLNALLQSPPAVQKRLIEKHYTPTASLTHALVCEWLGIVAVRV